MLDFLGIGAQKTGSTWLYEALSAHERVRFPAGKEVHFWDAQRARGLDWYRGLFAGGAPGTLCGEITPAYALLPEAIVREVRAAFPTLRVLYVIRDPIARAWSSALMALERAEMKPGEASDAWFLDHFRSAGSLARGDYETCLRAWRGAYGEEAVLVLRYEQLRDDPLGFVQACCRHIGADPAFYERARPEILGRRAFANPEVPIRESLLPVLREIYRPRIAAIAAYLGADLGAWLAR